MCRRVTLPMTLCLHSSSSSSFLYCCIRRRQLARLRNIWITLMEHLVPGPETILQVIRGILCTLSDQKLRTLQRKSPCMLQVFVVKCANPTFGDTRWHIIREVKVDTIFASKFFVKQPNPVSELSVLLTTNKTRERIISAISSVLSNHGLRYSDIWQSCFLFHSTSDGLEAK